MCLILEFECKNKSQVLEVINKLGTDLPNLLIDHSKDINREEIQEMEKLEKNLKDIVKVSLKNGLNGKTAKIDKAKEDLLHFFDEHQFYQLKDNIWKEFQEYYENVLKSKDLIIGGIYTYDNHNIVLIISDTEYLEFNQGDFSLNNKTINTKIYTYLNTLNDFSPLNIKDIDLDKISGYLGRISVDLEEKIKMIKGEKYEKRRLY